MIAAILASLAWEHIAAGGFVGTPDAEAELASFRVLEGFEISLFATEREGAVKPIQIRFDPAGRLWLVGSTTYPQIVPGEVPNDHVIRLEDTDGDGRADQRTVFADGLMIPTGLELGDGGVYVGAATELLHLRDADGDGRADQRRVVLRGFGTGDAHQTLNSLVWGPCGELMMSQGLHANSRVETPWGIAELRQAGVWRFWPRRLELEAFWSGAMGAHNPFGTVFDRWGQPLVLAGNGHGIYHLTPALIATDHFLTHPSLWNQGRKFGGGDFVENAHWPPERQGELVTGGYLHNSVERFRVTEAGASFQVERLPALVESTNTAFRVVDVRFGPDGALYLCDWHNSLIGHYQTSFRHPDRDRTRGRIWRVTAKGRPLVPRRALTAWSEEELVAQLRSGDRWHRQMAHRLLVERPREKVLPALRAWLARLPASESLAWVEGLGLAADLEAVEPGWIETVSVSPAFQARAMAMRVVGLSARALEAPLKWLERGVTDAHPRVRLEAVVACAAVRDVRAVEVALRVVDQPMDAALEYALTQAVHALKPWWAEAHASGTLKLGGRPQYLEALARADASGDTAAIAAGRLRRVGEVALEALEIERLAVQVARSGGSNEIPALLETRIFTLGAQYEELLHARSLATLADSVEVRGVRPTGDPAGPLSMAMAGTRRPELRAAAARLAGVWQVTALRDTLRTTA
ncbi:MAG: hypothetical protein IT580_21335, partial [Verrucomicrobiales bacterium]|nr:hypothetical protein [Verrucomicrobiales bacterium]